MDETILSMLKEEHQQINALMCKIERTRASDLKQETFEELKELLLTHMEGEEKTLYAKLRTEVYDEGAAEIANNADYEHQEIKDLLKMVDEQETGSEDWNELLQSLKESVMSHVQFEETQLFSEVKEDFSRDEQINIGTQFEEAKSHASFH
jgi:iron-sulfur cluster repair protein YtfE (RIC family)